MQHNIRDYVPPVYYMHPVARKAFASEGLHTRRYLRLLDQSVISISEIDMTGIGINISNDFTDYDPTVTDTPVAFRFKEFLFFTTPGNIRVINGLQIQPDLIDTIVALHNFVRQRDVSSAFVVINKLSSVTKNTLADTTRKYRAKITRSGELTPWQI